MNKLMTELASKAKSERAKKVNETGSPIEYACAHSDFNGDKISVEAAGVASGSKSEVRLIWRVNGKMSSKKKVMEITK